MDSNTAKISHLYRNTNYFSIVSSFRPVIVSRKSGRHEPTVTLGRQLMLPTWDVDFGNGYRYLLIYYEKAWGAIDAPGYSAPTRPIVLSLARAIMKWAVATPANTRRSLTRSGQGS